LPAASFGGSGALEQDWINVRKAAINAIRIKEVFLIGRPLIEKTKVLTQFGCADERIISRTPSSGA